MAIRLGSTVARGLLFYPFSQWNKFGKPTHEMLYCSSLQITSQQLVRFPWFALYHFVVPIYTLREVKRSVASKNNQSSNPNCLEWENETTSILWCMMHTTHYCSSMTTVMHIRLPLSIVSCRPHSNLSNPKDDFRLEFFKDTRS